MSEKSVADTLLSLAIGDLESGMKSIAKKATELAFVETMVMASQSIAETILNTENMMTALTKITVANEYAEIIKSLEQKASILPDSARKLGLQLQVLQFKSELAVVQQDFISTFAKSAQNFEQAVEDYLRNSGSAAGAAKKILGGVVGVVATVELMQGKLDEALAAGEPPEKAAEIIVKSVTSTATSTAFGIASAMKSFVDTGVADLRLRFLGLGKGWNAVPIGVNGRWPFVLARAGAAGMALTLAFEGGYYVGGLIYDTFGDSIGVGVDWAVEWFTDLLNNDTGTRYPNEMATLGVLISRIDPQASTEDVNKILRASASTIKNLAELTAFHNALRKILSPTLQITNTATPDAFFNEAVGTLRYLKDAYQGQTFSLKPLTDISPTTLVNLAQFGPDAIAYRYALKELNPFAILGTDYSSQDTNGELDLYDPATGQGELTEQYIEDRTRFLSWNIKASTLDKTAISDGGRDQWIAEDWNHQGASEYLPLSLDINSGLLGTTGNARKMIFGSDAGDNPIYGGDKDDRIYGMGGNDNIDGRAGSDYIEGGTGNDALYGGEGSDTLMGGTGDDILAGGKSADTLMGGLGNDTYVFTGGDGWDVIEDSDGQGTITYDGIQLTGGEAVGDSGMVWQQKSSGKTFIYILVDWTENGETYKRLSIQGPDGGMFVNRWQPGNLGITLNTSGQTQPPVFGGTITGDIIPTDTNPSQAGIQAAGDAYGNPLGVAGAYGDILLGSDGNDRILSGEMDDDVNGLGGDDWMDGGAGNDLIDGEDGDDMLEGGTGSNMLNGGAGNDRLYSDSRIDTAQAIANGNTQSGSGQKGSWLSGSEGDDLLIAGADNDVLCGGAGKDVLIAGAGDDYIMGDADWWVSQLTEPQERYTLNGTHWYHTGAPTYAWGYTDTDSGRVFSPVVGETEPAGGDADLIYAGAGNDTVYAGAGDDLVFGDGGNDSLSGNEGNDHLYGGAGNDYIQGDASYQDGALHGDDYLDGGDGNDTLWGEGGDDVLDGGAGNDSLMGDGDNLGPRYLGNDTLFGGKGNDSLWGGGGSDVLDGGAGDDYLAGDNGNLDPSYHEDDTLFGGDGNDTLWGEGGDDYLDGGDDNDYLSGGDDNDYLFGGEGNDMLWGDDGNDTLIGGGGLDALDGGTGDDTYIFRAGDGPTSPDGVHVETIYDASGDDTVILEGISADSLTVLNADSGLLVIGYDSCDRLGINGGASGTIEHFQIGDETLSTSELIGRYSSATIQGSNGGGKQFINGGKSDDTIVISLLSNGNEISGGRGKDTINILSTNNTIHYSLGDGTDTLYLERGGNCLRFGPGIGPDDLSLAITGSTLILRVGGNPDDMMRFLNFNADFPFASFRFDRIEFADGGSLSPAGLFARGIEYIYTEGDDTIKGSALADRILGGGGNDSLSGGGGNDTLDGGAGSDILAGGDGADTYLFGIGSGQDTINNFDTDALGVNPDTLLLGSGITIDDVVLTHVGADLIISLKGTSDTLTVTNYLNQGGMSAYAIENLQFADSGTVWDMETVRSKIAGVIAGTSGNDTLYGGDGGDLMYGYAGDDMLYGQNGNDVLSGGSGNDTLDGGAGKDNLAGGDGADTYLFGIGSGQDTLDNTDTDAFGVNPDTILLGSGITVDDVVLTRAGTDLIIHLKDTSDTLTVTRYFDQGGTSAYAVENLRFADDMAWDVAAVKRHMAPINGTAGDDTLYGYETDDTLNGWDGNDYLYGDAGDDVLNGGAGNDTLYGGDGNDYLDGGAGDDVLYGQSDDTLDGGAGNDTLRGGRGTSTYLFGIGSGQDLIYNGDPEGDLAGLRPDTLLLGVGITPDNVTLSRPGNDLVISLNGTTDKVTIYNYFVDMHYENPDWNQLVELENIQFAGGIIWNKATVLNRIAGIANHAPTLANAIADRQTNEDSPFVFTIPADTFADSDAGDSLIYGVKLANGDPLPAWLNFNAATRTFSGTPGNNDVGTLALRVTGTDTGGLTISDDFTLTIHNINDAPIVAHALTDQAASANASFAFTVPADTFIDIDVGDSLTYSAKLANGDPLPAWLSFDVATHTFSGTPASSDVGFLTLRITATDLAGASAAQNLILAIQADTAGSLINGTPGDDALIGTPGNDTINGLDGNDTLYGFDGNDVLDGGTGNDYLAGGDSSDQLRGGDGNDSLSGGAGSDTLDGGAGNDLLSGGDGADTYLFGIGSGQDTINNTDADAVGVNADTILLGAGVTTSKVTLSRYNFDLAISITGTTDKLSVSNYFNHDGTTTAAVENIQFADGTVWDVATILSKVMTSTTGTAGNDRLYGLDAKNDTLSGGDGNDSIFGYAGDDVLDGGNGADYISGGDGNDQMLGGAGNDTLYGDAGNDLLRGGDGNDALFGGVGIDILEGGSGDDSLSDSGDWALMNGGDGKDSLTGGGGAELYLGGTGNDTLKTGGGNDLILFNAGDGQDAVNLGGGKSTLSLGGNFAYGDLAFSKSGNDLILKMGSADQITFSGWYGSTTARSIVDLQVVAEAMQGFQAGGSNPLLDQKVEHFNFTGLVNAFDTARTANPTLTAWVLTDALLTNQLAGSDTAALGGDLAYQYGKTGTLAGIGLAAAQDIIGNASFGTQAQTFKPAAELQAGAVKLG